MLLKAFGVLHTRARKEPRLERGKTALLSPSFTIHFGLRFTTTVHITISTCVLADRRRKRSYVHCCRQTSLSLSYEAILRGMSNIQDLRRVRRGRDKNVFFFYNEIS